MTLDREGKIVLTYTPNNLEGHSVYKKVQATDAGKKCDIHGGDCHQGLFARNLYVGDRIPLAGVAHQNGTIRFGTRSEDVGARHDCRAHDVDNLYVVDAASSPPALP
ncbi:MAG: GMC oxidoreductase [Polyangiaceae bacterium]